MEGEVETLIREKNAAISAITEEFEVKLREATEQVNQLLGERQAHADNARLWSQEVFVQIV